MKEILTPRELAQAIGVSESSVKRWVDDGHIPATKTAGGHRRIAIHEAARYVREHGTPVVRPDILGLQDVAPLDGREEAKEEAADRLFDYLKSGAAAEARGLILSSYLEGASVAEIVDGPLSQAMERIGELWVSNHSGVFWEHRATQIAIQAVNRLRLLLTPLTPSEGAPAAVGGAPTGDRYILPSLAVAAVLEGEGIRAVNLGPDTPLATLALGVADVDARLAWLSVSVVPDIAKLRRQVEELIAELADRGTTLVIGGAESSRLGLAKNESVYVGRSMVEFEALVQGMRLASRPAAVSA